LLIYGFPKAARPALVRLSATAPSGPLSFAVDLAAARQVTGKSVATLAARARIRELEEGPEWLANRGSRQRERKQTGVTKEIIDLSIRYGLISRETSFVAVERRETPVVGDMQLRRVPIALTSGWGGIRSMPAPTRMLLGATLGPPDLMDTQVLRDARNSLRLERARLEPTSSARGFAGSFVERLLGRKSKLSSDSIGPSSAMHALVALQHADGHWELTTELATLLGRELSEIAAALTDGAGDRSDRQRAWATALAIAWLELNAGDAEEEWRLLRRKAQNWIDGTRAVAPGGVAWVTAARRFVRT
jgi:Ca-activated chloride channel family protein